MKKGISLIEVSMVMVIIGIMTSVGLVSFSSSRKSAILKGVQDEVSSAIKLAQNYALQGKLSPTSGNVPKKYGFWFTDNDTYVIFCCENINCLVRETVETYTLQNRVTLGSPGTSDTEIRFEIPNGKITYPPGILPVTFRFDYDTMSKSIRIEEGGVITRI